MATDLILGTAGHIDHGKTSLIRALTGVDTDRLPEEKRRGITIDLGFAHLDLDDFHLGIVDVPGHEKFVRNMLAGATGMDLAMLVVAADDSIKQQTREHLEILRMLDLKAGVIVITKCDLADPGWTELVADEVRTLVHGTFLADAPIVRTSVHTGQGLDELKCELRRAAERARSAGIASAQGPFRMAIDRTFSVAGHGTVVTGSVASGSPRRGRAADRAGRHSVASAACNATISRLT
jgi:selenocysteine-specific elongation factor